MKNLELKISKWNDGTKSYYLEDYCTSIKFSNSFSQIAAELSFEFPYTTLSSSLLAINIEMGDRVCLLYKTDQIFTGRVIDANRKGKGQTFSVTCYDYCWWVVKSNITKNFDNISVRDALEYVYKYIGATYDIDFELGTNGNIMVNSHLVKSKPASKVLYAIYKEVTNAKPGVYYYMHMLGNGSNTITITEADKYYSGLTIQAPTSLNAADGNLIDFEINESMQNMITRVDFYKTTGEIYDESKNIELTSENMARFGVIIENIEVDDDDNNAIKAIAEGRQKLDIQGKPSEELTVICYGNMKYKVAHGVMVKIPNTNYYDRFMYIVSSEWSWKKESMFESEFRFVSKLTLSPSKNQNLEDWKSIEEKQDSSNTSNTPVSGSSDLVNRIIAELKKHLGLAYVFGGHSPADGGMDCSGYVSYVYNQFASELEIKSNDGKLYPQTEIMMTEGKDVTNVFPDNLRPCDLIFPTKDHVVAYLGNKQIIEEPHSGAVCRIRDMYYSKVVKIIRVVPDSAWETKVSSSSSINGLVSSKLIDFIKGWEKFVSPAEDDGFGNLTIGYGTTSAANPDAVKQGTCTEEEATKWLTEEVDKCANKIKDALDKDNKSLPQNQFDCLADIAYNNGTGDLIGGNTWNSIINGEGKNSITNHILIWNHANGKEEPGLTTRCVARVRMFFDGVYDSKH